MEKSFPFNANLTDGVYDRVYSADDWAAERACYIGDGILTENSLLVTADSDMQIKAASGKACVQGRTYFNTDYVVFNVPQSSSALPRTDRVVLRADFNNREVVLAYKQGVPASVPVPAELTRTQDVYELPIAKISVAANAVSVNDSDITDERERASYPVDFEALIDEYTAELRDELDVSDLSLLRDIGAAVKLDGDGTLALMNDGSYDSPWKSTELTRYTTPGVYTFTKSDFPSDGDIYDFVIVGGGGGGGVTSGSPASAYSGGAGAAVYLHGIKLNRPSYTVRVGSGGTGASTSGNSCAGGSSSFGDFSASAGMMGAGGSDGCFSGENGGYNSNGGSGEFGTGGAYSSSGRGGSGTGYGSGGGAGYRSGGYAGGNGAGGLVIVYGRVKAPLE